MVFRYASFAKRVKTRESFRSAVDIVADFADQKLVVNVLHEFLASGHGDSCPTSPVIGQNDLQLAVFNCIYIFNSGNVVHTKQTHIEYNPQHVRKTCNPEKIREKLK